MAYLKILALTAAAKSVAIVGFLGALKLHAILYTGREHWGVLLPSMGLALILEVLFLFACLSMISGSTPGHRLKTVPAFAVLVFLSWILGLPGLFLASTGRAGALTVLILSSLTLSLMIRYTLYSETD